MCDNKLVNHDLAILLRITADEMAAMRLEIAELREKYTKLLKVSRHAITVELAHIEDELNVSRTVKRA